MELNINDDLIVLYHRINRYAVYMFGQEPTDITIEPDGTFGLVYVSYSCGECDTEYQFVSVDDILSDDLDALYKKRKEQEERERIAKQVQLERERQIELERTEKRERAELKRLSEKYGR